MPKEKEEIKEKNPKILFYIANYFIFRTAPVGYLYEICQEYPVVLLGEEFELETKEVLRNKNLFPKLEKIIPIYQLSGEKENLFFKNWRLWRLAKRVIKEENPDILICSSDSQSLFEMYLMRFAKRKNITRITIQTANICKSSLISKRVDLTNAYLRFPAFPSLQIRYFLVQVRKYFGHFLYYYLLPVSVGEKPFFGNSSYILYKGQSGMRDSNYQTVFSKKDYNIFLKDGVPSKKLYIVSHPFVTKTREFLKKTFWEELKKVKKKRKAVLLLLPEDEIGFKRSNFSLIPREDVKKCRMEITELIIKILSDWEVILKPHPDIKDIQKAISPLESLLGRIKIADKKEPVDKYIELSDVVIELPLAAGNTLFLASLQCPEKPIISLDFNQELLGDYYKDFRGIEYIDGREKLINVLTLIRDNKYQKNKVKLESEGFSGMVEFLDFILKNKFEINNQW